MKFKFEAAHILLRLHIFGERDVHTISSSFSSHTQQVY